MNFASYEFLTRTALASDQDGCVGTCDAIDQVVDLAHRLTGSEDPTVGLRCVNDGSKSDHLTLERVMLDGSFDDQRNRVNVEWFGNEVVCSRSHGFYRRIDTAKSRDDNDWQIGIGLGYRS